MKRGSRILLFLVLVIVILIAVAFLLLGGIGPFTRGAATPTPAWVSIVVVEQPISRDSQIQIESLSTMEIPPDRWNEKMIRNKEDVVGKYAIFNLAQGLPLTLDMVADRPGMSQPGSEAAKVIQPGLVAIAIPITRIHLGCLDGWHNGILSVLFSLLVALVKLIPQRSRVV